MPREIHCVHVCHNVDKEPRKTDRDEDSTIDAATRTAYMKGTLNPLNTHQPHFFSLCVDVVAADDAVAVAAVTVVVVVVVIAVVFVVVVVVVVARCYLLL